MIPWCAVVVAVAGLPSTARSQAIWKSSAYKGWTVSSVTIQGLDKNTASELKKGLALAQSSGFLGSTLPTYFPQTVDEDIQRSLLFLARRGYPYATVTPAFTPADRGQQVGVIFDIDTGPPVVVAATPVDGVPPSLEAEARDLLATGVGPLFSDLAVARAATVLDSVLTHAGYARARVVSDVAWLDSTHVEVRFGITPGALYYFGDVVVSGPSDDLVPLVKKTASIERGQRYSPQTLGDAERALRVLGLFRQIRIDLQDAATDTLDVGIDASTREARTFETNARYWTDDGLSAGARWTHRNLLRKGRGVSAVVFGSLLRQLAQVSVWWPGVLWARSRAVTTVGSDRENEEAYESVSTGIELSLRHEQSEKTTLRGGVSLTNEEITSKSVDPGAVPGSDGRLLALNFTWDHFGGNDPIVATRGVVWRGYVEWAPNGEISQHHYVLGETLGVIYVPAFSQSGFAFRLGLGLGEPIGESTSILPNKLFYSGGSNSMRGFERRKLGPLDSAGAPLGGQSKLEASAEYRFPLPWRFRGTLFVDTGQVWPEAPNLNGRKMEVAVGPGLWIQTPIGPIRGDVGYRLTDYEESQPRWVFHFSIGPAF
jgi:outer membrane protein insertion porin family